MDFGALALALSVVAIVAVIGSGTFDASVNLPPERARGFALFAVASGGGLMIGALLVVVGGMECGGPGRWSHRLWFVPFATVLTVGFNAGSAWANRERRFHVIARARVYLTLGNAVSATVLGFGVGANVV